MSGRHVLIINWGYRRMCINFYPREGIGGVVVNIMNISVVCGELRYIFNMTFLAWKVTFSERLNYEYYRFMISQNLRGAYLKKIAKVKEGSCIVSHPAKASWERKQKAPKSPFGIAAGNPQLKN